ncbi:transient receptor potential cation channel subfamily V member 1-like [Hemiscyllium ocellatum]|uniref:transient receptor potential cation channel subfamily V member 1-like n=1 Tax=Hemiscyllium ocellatum TaxID=170820 RepID=UPI002966954B|nr:transient receptor potential cation channel subfamily V member 1-like [Hemiscyllium ocellatum]
MKRLQSDDADQSEVTEETGLNPDTDDVFTEDEELESSFPAAGYSQELSKGPSISPSNLLKRTQQRYHFRETDSSKAKAPMDSFFPKGYQTSPKSSTVSAQENVKMQSLGSARSSEGNLVFKTYEWQWLFKAVSGGKASELDGLLEYLIKNNERLTDWKLRDPETGKTALLKALLNLNNHRNDTIPVLLEIAEKTDNLTQFVNAAYSDSYYKGQTALHIAIERRCMHFVALLIRNGADVHAKANGIFFKQKEGQTGFYFGELPLSLAACTNQLDVVTHLLENPYSPADISATDSMGNNVLHALVSISDNTKENTKFVIHMYDYLLRMGVKINPGLNLESMKNKKGLTPLKLAAKSGKIEVLKHIIGREIHDEECRFLSRKFTEWAYGPVHSSLYDLSSLDTYEAKSVLEIIIYGSEIPNRHEMLNLEPLKHLLQEKWNNFASFIFYIKFFIYLSYMIIFTTTAYNRIEEQKPPFKIEATTKSYLRVTGQIITIFGALYLFFQGVEEVFLRRKRTPKSITIDGYCDILFFLQAVLLLASSVLYVVGREEYVGFMVIGLAIGWINLLYYTRGFQRMGIYSVMMQKIFLTDIMSFLLVYVVFLFGFGAALVVLIEDRVYNNTKPGCHKETTYKNFKTTFLELFRFTIGMGDLEFTENYRFKEVFIFLLISYVILTYILLLNMLIALMSKTVEKISKDSKSVWNLQRAITILDLEKSLPRFLRARFRSGEPVTVGLLSDGREDLRWCFRVDEVNWTKWNTNLGLINEEPGNSDITRRTTGSRGRRARRERSWRTMLPLLKEIKLEKQEEDMRLGAINTGPTRQPPGQAHGTTAKAV